MARPREELQTLLEGLLGSRHVYFQPPESVRLHYPCIIYERSGIHTDSANNRPYKNRKSYKITVIDSDPDSQIPDKVNGLAYCRFDRHFVSDNLNHDIFNLYF